MLGMHGVGGDDEQISLGDAQALVPHIQVAHATHATEQLGMGVAMQQGTPGKIVAVQGTVEQDGAMFGLLAGGKVVLDVVVWKRALPGEIYVRLKHIVQYVFHRLPHFKDGAGCLPALEEEILSIDAL